MTKKRVLLIEKNKAKKKKLKWKNFKKMNPEEKKERIKYLWDKVKSYVFQLKFVKSTQKDLDNQFLRQFA